MKLVVANWKMNLNLPDSVAYFDKLDALIQKNSAVEVVLCPNFLSLPSLCAHDKNDKFKIGAQNCNAIDRGPLTGEVSASMLAGLADYVIVGHSERRQYFSENDTIINQKILAILRHGMQPILCVGADSDVLEFETVRQQIANALYSVTTDQLSRVVIAYEPPAAIGSGQAANEQDIAMMAQVIISQVRQIYGVNASPRVLYGGSVDDINADSIMKVSGINGLLIGTSSLDANKFAKIVKIVGEK